ncbi:MAG: hypothetical protein CSA75_02410 [Sorangium cellulosum]|nr:MAG: hypothetical protein CSA75_02410 [Sorangium cellulosum]
MNVVMWGVGAMGVARALHPKRTALGVLGFALAFQWALYMVFFSYVIASAIGLFTLTIALGQSHWTMRRRVLLAGLLCVQSLLHVFSALVCALVLVCICIFRWRLTQWPKQLGLLFVMGLPTLLVFAHAAGFLDPDSPAPLHDSGYSTEGLWDKVQLIRGTFVGGPAWRGWSIPLWMMASALLGAMRWSASKLSKRDKALLVAGLLLLAMYFVVPLHIPSWQFVSPRFLPMASVLLLLTLPIESASPGWTKPAVTVCVGAFASVLILWSAFFHRDLAERTRDAFAGLKQPLSRYGPRLPIVLDARAGSTNAWLDADYAFFEPLLNLGQLYAVEQGGVVPYTFTTAPQIHPFVLSDKGRRAMPPTPARNPFAREWMQAHEKGDAARLLNIGTRLAIYGSQFEDTILYTSGDEAKLFAQRGFRTDFVRGKLHILSYQGCPARFAARSSKPLNHAIWVEYGWSPVKELSWSASIPARSLPQHGWLQTPTIPTPCAKIWLRLFVDRDESASLSKGDQVCGRANDDGTLTVTLERSSEVVSCETMRVW